MSFRNVITLFSLFVLLAGLWACTEETFVDPVVFAQLRGQVVAKTDQKPLRGALIQLSPGGRITSTDASGSFRFDSVQAGKYTITATLANYRTEAVSVEASTSLVTQTTILMVTDDSQNRPPSIPTAVRPTSGTTNVPTSLTLKWAATDPGRDTLRYDVFLTRQGSTTPTQSFTNILADSVIVRNLDFNTTYYWQVTARDGVNTVNSPLFSFRTAAFPDYPYLYVKRVEGQFQIFSASGPISATGTGGNTTTSDERQLTFAGNNWRPIASPNRQQIAFISNVDGDLQLYTMNIDGSNLRRVTTVPIAGYAATDLSFGWSPDGTQLVYPSNERLYAVNTNGTGLRVLATAPFGRQFASADWNAATNRIATRTTQGFYNNDIVLVSLNGLESTTVLSRPNARLSNPVFSPDGRQLYLSVDLGALQNEAGRQLDARIHRIDLFNSNALVEITASGQGGTTVISKPSGTNDLEPRLDPTGTKLIFTNTPNTGIGTRSVTTLELDGRARTVLIIPGEMPYWR
jgi:TolB protein